MTEGSVTEDSVEGSAASFALADGASAVRAGKEHTPRAGLHTTSVSAHSKDQSFARGLFVP